MKKILFFLAILIAFTSCNVSKKVLYLQDVKINEADIIKKDGDIKLEPGDKISISVFSKDPQLATIFNLPIVTFQPGQNYIINSTSAASNEISGYIIDSEGYIDFPCIGKILVRGLTREQVAVKIKTILIDRNLLKDPVISINFMNMRVSVLGEVVKPGKIDFINDNMSILEAIGLAGDLTIYGKRDGVYVIRTEAGMRKTYHVDLRSSKLFESPVYYLRQNDIVYIQPNVVRAGQSTVNDNNVRSMSLWMSMTSVITSICILIFR